MAIPDLVTDLVGDLEREIDTVGERVKGNVVGIPDRVIDVV